MTSILFGDTQWDRGIGEESKNELSRIILDEESTILARYYKMALEMNPGLIRTPTRQVNKPWLDRLKLGDRLEAMINIAITTGQFAIEQMQADCLLAGSIGPLMDKSIKEPHELEKIFSEPAVFLIDRGADCLILEGFTNFNQFCSAIQTVKKVNTVPVPMAAFFKLSESFDKQEVFKVVEFCEAMELELTGFEVTVEMLPRLTPMLPKDDTAIGMQIINPKNETFSKDSLEGLSQSIRRIKPTMLLAGQNIPSQDWKTIQEKTGK